MSRRSEDGFGPITFGHCMSGDHRRCKAVLRRPDLVEKGAGGVVVRVVEADRVSRCACPCHEGQDVPVPEAAPVTRQAPRERGARDRRLVDQLSDALEKTGTAELPIPEGAGKKEQNCLNSRLHTAARRRGMKVSVTKSRSGKTWVAVVKGGTRKGAGK